MPRPSEGATWLRKLLDEQRKATAVANAGWQAARRFVRSGDIVLGHT